MQTTKQRARQAYDLQLTQPGLKEAIREPLYDFLTYDSAATVNLPFFQNPISSTKTKSDTNMELGGQLQKEFKFNVEMLELHVLPGSSASAYAREAAVKTGTSLAAPNFANDVWALMSKGYLIFKIGSKEYLTAPLLMFPPCSGLGINAAAAVENTNTTVLNQITVDYARLVGKPWVFDPVLPITGGTGFSVTLYWDSAITLPSGFDARIGVVLRGLKFREG